MLYEHGRQSLFKRRMSIASPMNLAAAVLKHMFLIYRDEGRFDNGRTSGQSMDT
jgi:hypothetical protein